MSNDSYVKAAFDELVKDAVAAEAAFVSLYLDVPFYGGPEEGGWWGSDTELVAYHRCVTAEQAELLKAAVIAKSEELNKEAKDRFNAQCARELEWLEENDPLCDDAGVYFPEPDGEVRYWVAIETRPGSFMRQGERSYS